jgi:hypothetical protein
MTQTNTSAPTPDEKKPPKTFEASTSQSTNTRKLTAPAPPKQIDPLRQPLGELSIEETLARRFGEL